MSNTLVERYAFLYHTPSQWFIALGRSIGYQGISPVLQRCKRPWECKRMRSGGGGGGGSSSSSSSSTRRTGAGRTKERHCGRQAGRHDCLKTTRCQQHSRSTSSYPHGPAKSPFTKMGLPLRDTFSKKRHEIRKQWYRQLKGLVSNIEVIPDRPVLDHKEQQRLGISMLTEDAPHSEHEARYFTPVLPENLPISPCCPSRWVLENGGSSHESLWPRFLPDDEEAAELVDDYYDGRHLASVISHHLSKLRWRYPSPWKETS